MSKRTTKPPEGPVPVLTPRKIQIIWNTSDGREFPTKEEAQAHEQELFEAAQKASRSFGPSVAEFAERAIAFEREAEWLREAHAELLEEVEQVRELIGEYEETTIPQMRREADGLLARIARLEKLNSDHRLRISALTKMLTDAVDICDVAMNPDGARFSTENYKAYTDLKARLVAPLLCCECERGADWFWSSTYNRRIHVGGDFCAGPDALTKPYEKNPQVPTP